VTFDLTDRQLAVLDTSFWTMAYRAEVVANCLDLFQIVVPRAVEVEIRTPQAGAPPQREYPYATLFRHLRDKLIDPPDDAPARLSRFGAGEAAAIPLAQQLGAVLLINERRAAAYAVNLGVVAVRVSDVVVALRLQDVVSDRAARRKLDVIAGNTSPEIIEQARQALAQLAPANSDDAHES
jgi:predicted nucleic acid-binding protein